MSFVLAFHNWHSRTEFYIFILYFLDRKESEAKSSEFNVIQSEIDGNTILGRQGKSEPLSAELVFSKK